jgi:hypothetical protein
MPAAVTAALKQLSKQGSGKPDGTKQAGRSLTIPRREITGIQHGENRRARRTRGSGAHAISFYAI